MCHDTRRMHPAAQRTPRATSRELCAGKQALAGNDASGSAHSGGRLTCSLCREACTICASPAVELTDANIVAQHANVALLEALQLLERQAPEQADGVATGNAAAQVASWLQSTVNAPEAVQVADLKVSTLVLARRSARLNLV
jgi:hypothetical protein